MIDEVSAGDLLEQMRSDRPPFLLDVRSRGEYVAGHLSGAKHIPFWSLPWRVRELEAVRDERLVVYCGHGPRARIAIAILRRSGFTHVHLLRSHISGWRRAKLPEATGVD